MRVISVIASSIGNNTYILLTKKPTIIDPSENVDVVLNHLKEYMKPEDLEYIILTHYHFDHVSGAPKLKEETNAKVMIHELDASFLSFKPDKTLKNNDMINLGNCSLKVIHTPGHTPGSICLYEPKSKILFSGDTIFSHGHVGRTDLPGGSPEQLIESIKKISKLNLKTLYPGHGKIVNDGVNEQISNSLEFLNSI
jgi:glyoxylase-like metal-dependent hydrolase (beta-lactamase superfamily II)